MKTKIMAVMAVLLMAFAGFAVLADNGADADATEGDLTLVFNDVYVDDTKGVITYLTGDGAEIYYLATLDDDFEEKITILNKEYYDAIKEYIKGFTVTVPLAQITNADIVEGLATFTSVETNRAGDIVGGLSTKIVFADVLNANVTYDMVDVEDAEVAVAVAVAAAIAECEETMYDDAEVQAIVDAAVAEVKESYKDYKSPEEVAKIIADTKALFKDYKSPAEVEKIVDDAVAQATKKAEDNNIWMIAFAVMVVLFVALGAYMIWTANVKKTKAQAPKAPKEPTE